MPTKEYVSWKQAHARVGRNDLIATLVHWLPWLDPADLPMAVYDSWHMAEWPERLADSEVWVVLFDRAGYAIDGLPADVTTDLGQLITLYRGSIPERKSGMAWSRSQNTAHWFAHRFDGIRDDKGGKVWKITIPTDFVLARMSGRGEDEIVVDTSDFDESEYEEI